MDNGIEHVFSSRNDGICEINLEEDSTFVCHVLSVERIDFKKRIH